METTAYDNFHRIPSYGKIEPTKEPIYLNDFLTSTLTRDNQEDDSILRVNSSVDQGRKPQI